MRKKKHFTMALPVMILLFAFSPLHSGIEVTPTEHDFGEVMLGDEVSCNITLSNDWLVDDLTINSITIEGAGGGVFILVNPPPAGAVMIPGSSLEFGVLFSPNAEGFSTAVLRISWSNGENGTSWVTLSGTGVGGMSPLSIEDILCFFDASVAEGSLTGAGPGMSGQHRLNALRNMLLTVAGLLEDGHMEDACEQLRDLYIHSTAFAGGDALAELREMVFQLMADMGCI